MPSDASSSGGDIQAVFHFLKWQDLYVEEKPFQIYINIPKGSPDQRTHNLVFEEGDETTVHDVRDRLEDFTLDKNGFTYVQKESALPSSMFNDRSAIEKTYLPECEALIKEHVGDVDQVYVFDWRVRSNDHEKFVGKLVDFNNPVHPLGPATHVHVDQSPGAALRRVQLHLPEQAEELLKGRLRIINVWKPINGPVQEWPLAVCDGSTVQPENLIETDHVRRQYAGVTLYALKDSGMQWYYMRYQKDDEVLLFKNFDSLPGVVPYAPHASFPFTKPGVQVPPRESIEVRALVFTYAT